jgi:multidrug resistance efflux pump
MVSSLLYRPSAMRFDHRAPAEVSTMRRGTSAVQPPPTNWGMAPEAPTHLPPGELDIETNYARPSSKSKSGKRGSDSIITSAPRGSLYKDDQRVGTEPEFSQPRRVRTEEASHAYQPSRRASATPQQPVRVSATPSPTPTTAPRGEPERVAKAERKERKSFSSAGELHAKPPAPVDANATLISVAEAAIAQGPQAVQAALQAATAQGPQVLAALQAALQHVIAQLQAQQQAQQGAQLPPEAIAAAERVIAQGPQAVQAALLAVEAQGPQMLAVFKAALEHVAARAQAPHSSVQLPLPAPRSASEAEPFQQFNGGAAFDPLAVPLPPEIAPSIYGWLRRLALQADLAAADRLLRDALADLTSSLSVIIIYAGPDGYYTLGPDDELPKDTSPIATVGKARRALVGTHSGLVPIATPAETIGVIQLVRNSRQPAFSAQDHITMAAIARESASVMHHLVVQHLQRNNELAQDKKSLYRPEALDSHRKKGQEGSLCEMSPRWVKLAYPMLTVTVLVALGFAALTKVPTYSTGSGVVVYPGTPVTSSSPGQLEKFYVEGQAEVKKGDILFKIKSEKEEADLKQARTESENAQAQYLFDSNDEQAKKSIISAQAAQHHAEAMIEQKTVRAAKDGIVSDIRIHEGQAVQFGEQVLTIVDRDTLPEVWAFLPGSDRPRLRPGQVLQTELAGFTKGREEPVIYSVGRDVIGMQAARQSVNPSAADSLKLAQEGSYVLVKAKLKQKTFKTEHRTYTFFDGMPAKTEVKVESKRFIITLIPAFEKYLD